MPEAQANIRTPKVPGPPRGTLGDLVRSAHLRAAALAGSEQRWLDLALEAPRTPSLEHALSAGRNVSVIAEIKRASPSRGAMKADLDATHQALELAAGGAAGLSVLTEPERFLGSDDDLEAVARAVTIPVIRKDFHVAPAQLFQARALGATAALLIVRALDAIALKTMFDAGTSVGLELVVEVRDEEELARAVAVGARMIGVNNRDLETLLVHPSATDDLIPLVPDEVIAIAESGMSDHADVERAAIAGADAVLVGSALTQSSDPRAAVASIAAVPRNGRANRH